MGSKELKELSNNVKQIMSTQLTETEVMVYLLVKSGHTYREVAELPFGFTHETARSTFERAEKKMDIMSECGVFSTPIK